MSCLSCEKYEKRISNVFRDEELKEKFEKLIGYPITVDCFICDNCNAKLQEVIEFQENCIKVYQKNNPNYRELQKLSKYKSTNKPDENKKQNGIYILRPSEEIFINETLTKSKNDNNQYTVYEIDDTGKGIQIKEKEEDISAKKPSRLKDESIQECLIIEKESDIEDNFIMNEELVSKITEKRNISYKVEENDESSHDSKKPRKSYSVQQKLEIIEYAEKFSNREAARKFELNESTIRCFRRQKESLQEMNPKKSTKRHGIPYWPDLEFHLKAWAEKQPVKPKMTELREKAIRIAKSLGYKNFTGSNTYIFKFMQRNKVETASPRPRKKMKLEIKDESG